MTCLTTAAICTGVSPYGGPTPVTGNWGAVNLRHFSDQRSSESTSFHDLTLNQRSSDSTFGTFQITFQTRGQVTRPMVLKVV